MKQYRDRIQGLVPDLDIRHADLNQEGLVNDLVVVNGRRVYRLPKNDRARDVSPLGNGWPV